MNKRACIDYVKEQQEKSWKQPTSFEKRTGVYNQCKEFCKKNGYTGRCFEQIWNAATRERAIKTGSWRG